jgi:broad specificity phosphatase PhoE
MTRLILCRHAEPANAAQTLTVAEALAENPLAAVYTSPLARAVETATTVADAQGLVPIPVDDLREIDFGEVEGLAFDALPVELQAGLLRAPMHVRFPGGETYGELQGRVCRAIDRIVTDHPEATVAAVTHAGSIRTALAAWLHIVDEAIFRIDQRYAAVNVVDWIDGIPLVRLVNGARP